MLLRGATIVSRWSSPAPLRRADVRIKNGLIVEVATELQPDLQPNPGESTVELDGGLLAPGFVCGHTHLYSTLARGMPPAGGTPPENFLQILEKVWWRLDKALDEPSVRASARIGAMDALHCGTVGLIDHHASPNYVAGSLDTVATALREIGCRGLLCYETSTRDGAEITQAGLAENERFVRHCATNDNHDGWVAAMLGAHASFTLDDATLDALAALSQQYDVGLHVHVAEGPDDRRETLARYGSDLLTRYAQRGLLRPGTILAHCVELDDDELQIAAKAGCTFAHNPSSNLNNRVGFSALWQKSEAVMLGTDGIGADMFSEAKMAWFRGTEATGALSPQRVLAMLDAAADTLYGSLGVRGGTIAPGCVADLQWLRYDSPTPLAADTLAGHVIFGMGAHLVRHVWVGGRWVLRDGTLIGLDEAAERVASRAQASDLWMRR